MKELFRSNDAVYLSFAQAILTAEGIQTFLLDANMASVEGSLGALPRRLMVAEDDYEHAKRILAEAEPAGEDTSLDGFLDGRVMALQPKHGFRAGHDTVLLAAAVPAKAGEHMLELGAGVGIVSLCLAARVPGVNIAGVEIDSQLVTLANANAERNGMDDRVEFAVANADCLDVEGATYDHVFFNPPFHPETGQVSPSPARDRATRGGDVAAWMQRAVELTAPGGTVTAIVRADRAGELAAGGGALTVLPLLARAGETPKRVIVQLRKGEAGAVRTLDGFVLHEADGRPTEAAEAVLRHAAQLLL